MAWLRMSFPFMPTARRDPRHGRSCCCLTCAAADRALVEWDRNAERVRAFNDEQEKKEMGRAAADRAAWRKRSLLERIFG